MSMVIFISLFVMIATAIIYFLLIPEDRNRFIKPDEPIDEVEPNPIAEDIVKQNESVFITPKSKYRKFFQLKPPRHMTEQEKYLYSIKPNLQYWVDIYGESIFTYSVDQLKKMFEFRK